MDQLLEQVRENLQTKTEEQVFLTVDEAAVLLRINRNTLYDAIKRGQVPGVRQIGRCIRICRVTVLRWFRGEGTGTLNDGVQR